MLLTVVKGEANGVIAILRVLEKGDVCTGRQN